MGRGIEAVLLTTSESNRSRSQVSRDTDLATQRCQTRCFVMREAGPLRHMLCCFHWALASFKSPLPLAMGCLACPHLAGPTASPECISGVAASEPQRCAQQSVSFLGLPGLPGWHQCLWNLQGASHLKALLKDSGLTHTTQSTRALLPDTPRCL